MDRAIKIFLAILLFVCLIDMPHGFYQIVRYLGLIGFIILAYLSLKQNRQTEMIVYCGLAILFQPFLKVTLGRQIWNIVDILVGIGLILSMFKKSRS
jgi:hypothetical protein